MTGTPGLFQILNGRWHTLADPLTGKIEKSKLSPCCPVIKCSRFLIVAVGLAAMPPERRTGATLGDMQLRSHLLNAATATRGA